MQKTLDSLFIFLTGIILFTIGLHSQEIIGFEARFYLFAMEMMRHGPTWFPTTYQTPYPDYPATSTYFIYLMSKLMGSLNKWTAVLPSAIASAVTLMVTYLIGATRSRIFGWCSVFFLLFTLTFITEARTISLDQYITMVTVICFYLVYSKKENYKIFTAITGLLLCSFAIRGPLGIVIPAGVVCMYYLLENKIKSFFIVGFFSALLLVVCTTTLLILAHHVGGPVFMQDVIRMQVASRMQDISHPPLLFYFTECIGGYAVTYPLAIAITLASLPALFKKQASKEIKFLRLSLGWVLIILIGLSIPGDKKLRYILPISPALAFISAFLWVGEYKNCFLSFFKNAFKLVCFILPLLALLFLFYVYNTNYFWLAIIFSLLQIGMFLGRKKETLILGLASLTFFTANAGIIENINLDTNRTREFVVQLENVRVKNHSPLVFFQEGKDGLPIKYLVNMSQEETPIYLYQSDELLQLKAGTLVIVGKENFSHILPRVMTHFKIKMQGKIGHDDVIVLIKPLFP